MDASFMQALEDDRLVVLAQAEMDPLTSTPLEAELLARINRLLDEQEHQPELLALTDEYDLNPAELRALVDAHASPIPDMIQMLTALNDAGIDTRAQLEDALKLADRFRGLANDAGDLFERLSTLSATTQE